MHVASLAVPVGGGAFEEPMHVEVAELVADLVGCGGDQGAHLVQRLGA